MITFDTLQERLGRLNIRHLMDFKHLVESSLFQREVPVSCYVVGSSTFPDDEYKKMEPVGDIDVIIAAHFKGALTPYDKKPSHCQLRERAKQFFGSGELSELPGIKNPEVALTVMEKRSRGELYLGYFRPNGHVDFKKGLTIHAIVHYFSPQIFDNPSQYTFSECITGEVKNGGSFCLF